MNNVLRVHPSNAGQLGAWDGAAGTYWADHADRFDRSVAEHHADLLDAAAIGGDERVLDVGCGAGQTTLDAARLAAAGSATGIDLSAAMLAVARRRALDAGVANAEFEQGDAQVHEFAPASYDVVLSRTGCMFFADPVAAFANIAKAVRPGGRLAILTWRTLAENEWMTEIAASLAGAVPDPPPDAPGPFSLAAPDRVRGVLADAGWRAVEIVATDGTMWFGDTPDHAVAFVVGFAGWMLDGRDAAARDRALGTLHDSAGAHHTDRGVRYRSAGWLVTATRTR